jgi:type IV pilus assembly protein PilN
MAVLVVVGIGLILGLRAFHQKAEEARKTEQQVQSKIDAINHERQGYQELMRQPANAELLTQAAALNQLFDEKTFSWTLAMEDLETVLPGGVQVTTLEPVRDTKTGRITLKLRVVGPRDHADDLVENLEHSRHFLMPHIVGESTESAGGPNERLMPVSANNRFSFELQAEYNSAVPLEHKTQKKSEKSSADSPHTSHPASLSRASHPLPGIVAPMRAPMQPPYPGMRQFAPNGGPNRNPNSNPGGPR